ncbi:MAG: protein kinase domain-containing protein, partial [Thermoanaerobaculia bacterium]
DVYKRQVYKARDETLEREVALKTLSPEFLTHVDRVRRFMQEARSASALNHPHIVTIYEIGQVAVPAAQAGGAPDAGDVTFHYIAMEFIDGQTMRQMIARGTDIRRLLEVMSQVCDGLAKAHGAGIVHRDLKPDNIMITTDGYAKIVDFGLAKLTEKATQQRGVETTAEGVVMGTAAYMSPEQVQGLDIDHRSDIFSLGSILYEAVTQRRPFASDSSIDTMHRIVFAEPQPISMFLPLAPPELQAILDGCLAKSPDERYQSTRDMANDLRAVAKIFDAAVSAGKVGATMLVGGGAPREAQSPASGQRAAVRQPQSGAAPGSHPPAARIPSGGVAGTPTGGAGKSPSGGASRAARSSAADGPHLVDAIEGVEALEPARPRRSASKRSRIDIVSVAYWIVLAAVLALSGWLWYTWPDFSVLKSRPASTPAIAALRDEGVAVQWAWVPYEEIAPSLRRAVVELVDADFYDESLSVDSVALALRGAKERERIPTLKGRMPGNSGITRGAVRSALLGDGLLANAQAMAFAVGLEKKLTRREILVLYLNTARFDEAVFGAEAAAKHYFDKPAKSLTVNEAALLALELVDPDRVDPKQPDDATAQRRDDLAAKIRGDAKKGAGEKGSEGRKSSSTSKSTSDKTEIAPAGDPEPQAKPETTAEPATPEPEAEVPASEPPATETSPKG